ncbi:hypothetical protein Enr13x_78140 [Stieleria neptunia]|uniref:Uncharacterized protein n=1 Tax=Stieleria neptunia TaxID=2527979 RepID=A0A518I488_9BACT|nr:hypothetical protein [Stieleria neptunia]QDV47902.1 hypothetical protein Enr13x_78140 [Stieleria neptunia]
MCRPDARFLWLFTLTLTALITGRVQSQTPASTQTEPRVEFEALVAGLAADSFATRGRSETRLIDLAIHSESSADQIKALLRANPFPPPDLELYLSKQRLLNRLEMREREILMERFLYDASFDGRELAGWEQFRDSAGGGHDARLVFASAVQDRPEIGRLLAGVATDANCWSEIETLDRHDIASWSVVLSLASARKRKTADGATLRLVAHLSNPGSGPEALRDHESRVLSRLVGSFLTETPIDLRDRLVIGLRYDCDRIVESDCRRALNDPTESPSRIVTALLAASELNFAAAEIDTWITSFSADTRVSHVWRSMVPPKTTHRTQVRDVALALALHRQGIDPRTRGFGALVADPILVFRPYSLGFESETARQRAHAHR